MKLINTRRKELYYIEPGMFFHKIGDEIYMGVLNADMDSELYEVSKWVSLDDDGTINIDKNFEEKTLKDIILGCKRISIIPAIYLVKKS